MRLPLVAATVVALAVSSAAFAQEAPRLPSGLPFPAWSPPLTTVPSEAAPQQGYAPKKGVLMEPVYQKPGDVKKKKKKKKAAEAPKAEAVEVPPVAQEQLATPAPEAAPEVAPEVAPEFMPQESMTTTLPDAMPAPEADSTAPEMAVPPAPAPAPEAADPLAVPAPAEADPLAPAQQ